MAPVPLDGQRQSPHRRLRVVIATIVLIVFTLFGLVYMQLWQKAGADITQLLPADAPLYAEAPAPISAIAHTVALPQWRSGRTLERLLSRRSFWSRERDGDIAGIPLPVARELLVGAEHLKFSLVDSPAGPTALLFFEMSDLLVRNAVNARVEPLTEQVDRHVGFPIRAVRQSRWRGFTGAGQTTPRVVQMAPYLVLSWGAQEGLEQLLEARVSGLAQDLGDRTDFRHFATEAHLRPLVAYLEPKALAAILAQGEFAPSAESPWPTIARGPTRPPPPERSQLLEGLSVLNFKSDLGERGERLEINMRLADEQAARKVSAAFVNTEHQLYQLAPVESPWLVSLTTSTVPVAALGALRELVIQLKRDLPQLDPSPALAELAAWLSEVEYEAVVRLEWEVAEAFAGELMLVGMPPAPGQAASLQDWLLLAELADPIVVEQALSRLLPFILGTDFAYGDVRVTDGILHLVRPIKRDDTGSAGGPEQQTALAWRVREGRLEMAPSLAILDRFGETTRTIEALSLPGGARGWEQLPQERVAFALLSPDFLVRTGFPLMAQLGDRLHPNFRVAIAVTHDDPWLVLHSNIGLWSLATVVASANRDELDLLTLPGLSAQCREAHEAMCAMFPHAAACRPFSLGRRDPILAACRKMFSAQRAP